ncbi:prolyl oligopeptidase family serine peptidase [Paenibacillus sp. IB182496]|uniref:Prolyl oligopeptidase family serine peptidase n=1 Tax=Paenibacillus sabuli TaxID=2772509 RepID=A0A927BQB3_9BACL|nr:prolyl oligopeptidase family serine peptidase [Paenibacillus sabuli]MBD2843800.1 prolyl oligopeptidase family serine peptidase [Paenibacillus sabuli]
MFEQYEDNIRLKARTEMAEFVSPYQDFRKHASSVTPGIRLGVNVIKPQRPGPVLMQLHGWHMSMPAPARRDSPLPGNGYLMVQVDMRGRAFSDGRPDCNGLELMDLYDAVQFVRAEYAQWISAPELVYLEGGSGGGGNVMAAVGKFPDLFAAATAYYGMSDYAAWYEQDQTGEFRDELDVWVGGPPAEDTERYRARSGCALAPNLLTPLYMAHGEHDIRVPVSHSRAYMETLRACGKQRLAKLDVLHGVGGKGHQDGMSEQQRTMMLQASEDNRRRHAAPPVLPSSGRLAVGGYVVTQPLRVRLEHMGQFAWLDYDLAQSRFRMTARGPYRYTITLADGATVAGTCTPDPTV